MDVHKPEAMAGATDRLAAAHREAAQAAMKQRLAEMGLAGGLVGLESDIIAVHKAQADLASGTGNHREQVIALQGAVLTLAGDMDAYNKQQGKVQGGSHAAIGALVGLGRQFGLTRSDILDAANQALRYQG